MTKEQIKVYTEAMQSGAIPDEKNPLHMLHGVHTDLLVKIVGHAFDVVTLARYQLMQRGKDLQGRWVGFKEAERIYRMEEQRRSAPLKKPSVKRKGPQP